MTFDWHMSKVFANKSMKGKNEAEGEKMEEGAKGWRWQKGGKGGGGSDRATLVEGRKGKMVLK